MPGNHFIPSSTSRRSFSGGGWRATVLARSSVKWYGSAGQCSLRVFTRFRPGLCEENIDRSVGRHFLERASSVLRGCEPGRSLLSFQKQPGLLGNSGAFPGGFEQVRHLIRTAIWLSHLYHPEPTLNTYFRIPSKDRARFSVCNSCVIIPRSGRTGYHFATDLSQNTVNPHEELLAQDARIP